jgi:hypothetical protein
MSNLEANRLKLRSDLAELKRLAGWLKAQAQQELSADTSFAIQLCLEEAALRIAAGNSIRPNSRRHRWQSRSRRRKSAISEST